MKYPLHFSFSASNGWPLLKAMFLNYPGDPTCWLLEDQFMFGEDMLVAPLLEENKMEKERRRDIS